MAKFSKGILGGFSGKIGNVIGGSWNGIDYMRSRPTKVRNPNTPAQQAQRMKFSMITGLMRHARPFVNAGFMTRSRKLTPRNAATSHNLKNAIAGTYPDLSIDYPSVLLSRGDLLGLDDAAVASDVVCELSITWTDNSGVGGSQVDDRLMAFVYNEEADRALNFVDSGVQRVDGAWTLSVPANWAGQTVQVYLGLLSPTGSSPDASDSIYLGEVTVFNG
jgi:hypothetical protein